MKYLLNVFFFIGFVCIGNNVDGFTPFPRPPQHLENWAQDTELQSLMGDQCDFPIISLHDYGSFADIPFNNTPFIIRNATYFWAANYNWHKGMFQKLYGDRVLRTGSESSIVYSGGNSEVAMYVKDLLAFPDNGNTQKESFVFDTTILQAIPELWSDFEIPKLFQEWDSEEREKNRLMWHFMSLGPSRSGLPYHNHGKTWIGVVYGSKKWYMYPMGYGAPAEMNTLFDASLSVYDWLQTIYPRLQHYPKPPATAHNTSRSADIDDVTGNGLNIIPQSERMEGHRPLECVQQPGDMLFIPSMWSHLTINIGETIAIGGQEALQNEERLSLAKTAYVEHPKNYEATKDYGLSIYNIATSKLEMLRSFYNPSSSSSDQQSLSPILHLVSKQDLITFMKETGDTTVVLYYLSTIEDLAKEQLIVQWKKIVDEIYLELPIDFIMIPVSSLSDAVSYPYQLELLRSHELQNLGLPDALVMLYSGLTTDAAVTAAAAIQGNIYQGDLETFPSYLKKWVDESRISFGSLHTLPVIIRAQLQEATDYLSKAIEIKSLQPEALSILCDAYAQLNEIEQLYEITLRAESLYDTLVQEVDNAEKNIPNKTLASLYHKLAIPFLHKSPPEYALQLLNKSIYIFSSFAPAWRDYFWLMVRLHQKDDAQVALQRLQDIFGALSQEDIRHLSDVVNSM